MQSHPRPAADSSRYNAAVYGLAVAAAGALLHYGYNLAPVQHQAQVWNIAGALCRFVMLAIILWRVRGLALAPGAWWLAEEALVVGCSTAFILRPWVVPAGQDQCSALLGYDLGKVSAAILMVIVAYLYRRSRGS